MKSILYITLQCFTILNLVACGRPGHLNYDQPTFKVKSKEVVSKHVPNFTRTGDPIPSECGDD